MEITYDENVKAALATATPKTLGRSVSYVSRLKNGLRPITADVADKLGFDMVITFVPRAPQPAQAEPETFDRSDAENEEWHNIHDGANESRSIEELG